MLAMPRLHVILGLWVCLPLIWVAVQIEGELLNAIRKSDVASVKTLLTRE